MGPLLGGGVVNQYGNTALTGVHRFGGGEIVFVATEQEGLVHGLDSHGRMFALAHAAWLAFGPERVESLHAHAAGMNAFEALEALRAGDDDGATYAVRLQAEWIETAAILRRLS